MGGGDETKGRFKTAAAGGLSDCPPHRGPDPPARSPLLPCPPSVDLTGGECSGPLGPGCDCEAGKDDGGRVAAECWIAVEWKEGARAAKGVSHAEPRCRSWSVGRWADWRGVRWVR